MTSDDPNWAAPIFLPEFGLSVSWAMCRNPSCDNFGIHYTGPQPGESGAVSDERYRIEAKSGRIRCKYCEQSFTLKSNLAIRPLARYFLSLSLPFADCPNAACENHGYNAFEHHVDSGARQHRRYRRESSDYRMACRACGARFSIGEALQITRNRDRKRSVRDIVEGMRTRRSVTDTIEATRIATGTYYDRLDRVARRLRDYHAWRNAHLLRKEFGNAQELVRVYTDTLQVSLQRLGDGARFQKLDIVVSVVGLEKTYYVLAAHAGFLPDTHYPGIEELIDDSYLPASTARWDCIQHAFRVDATGTPEETMEALPSVGSDGCYTVPHYTEIAHFLVVRKMLSRFPEVNYTMDGSQTLYSAALTALADDIRSRRAEIVLFQHEKERRAKGEAPPAGTVFGGKKEEKPALLEKAWKEMQARVADRMTEKGRLLPRDGADLERKKFARQFKHAFKGAYSKPGGWAWLTYPPSTPMYRNARSLWLTWMPGKQFENHGKDLLTGATLQPVDSAFNVLRQRTRGLRRAVFRARPGRSYLDSYFDPKIVCAELWIGLLLRNYGKRVKSRRKTVPAETMGLTRPKEPELDLVRHAWDFRLGTSHARRLSRWLHQ